MSRPVEPKDAVSRLALLVVLVIYASNVSAALVGSAPPANAENKKTDAATAAEHAQKLSAVYQSVAPEDEKGFQRMAQPKLGEWLARVHEPAISFEDYCASSPVRSTVERHTLVLQPLGHLNEQEQEVLSMLKDYAEAFFELPARIEPPLELVSPDKNVSLVRLGPRDRHGNAESRYEAEKVNTHVLLPHLPADALLYIGIASADLWADDGGVFGYASLENRTGVCSFYRIFPKFWEKRKADEKLPLMRRACRLLAHETGHMLGLSHCIFYHCTMNGCQGLAEADATPLHYCPVCERKLRWNLAYDPEKRGTRLQEFYTKYGMTTEADWWKTRAVK